MVDPNNAGDSKTSFYSNEPNSGRVNFTTKIPMISRQLASNTAVASNKNSRLDNSVSPTAGHKMMFERSKTQGKLKQELFSNREKFINHNADTEVNFSENLQRATSEINMLRQELRNKNTELQRLKKLSKIQEKCKTPHNQLNSQSPKKHRMGASRGKIKSRLTTGDNRRKQVSENDNDNSQSDEYYETTKMSPSSSHNNSVYSKGIPQIKSSQS